MQRRLLLDLQRRRLLLLLWRQHLSLRLCHLIIALKPPSWHALPVHSCPWSWHGGRLYFDRCMHCWLDRLLVILCLLPDCLRLLNFGPRLHTAGLILGFLCMRLLLPLDPQLLGQCHLLLLKRIVGRWSWGSGDAGSRYSLWNHCPRREGCGACRCIHYPVAALGAAAR